MRRDFVSFLIKVFETLHPGKPALQRAWYLLAICHALMKVWNGEDSRLVVLVPPRHLKSITASVAFVAWLLGHDPTLKIMVATYSEELSRHHSEFTNVVMESAWYKELFPATRISKTGN